MGLIPTVILSCGVAELVKRLLSTPKVSGSNPKEAQAFSKTILNISRPHYLKCASNSMN